MFYWITTHIEIVVVVALTLLAAVVILQQRRTPQSAAAWLLFFMVLPWVAVPLFLGLGFRKQSRRFAPVHFVRGDTGGPPPQPAHALDETFQHYGLPAACPGQSLELLHRPETAHAALLDLIAGAEHTLDALFYSVTRDEVGEGFLDALAERARAGVRVRLLLDRLGTGIGPTAALKRLREAGGQMYWYSPFLQLPGNGHLNLRNHRKMVVADGLRVFAGGMNIGQHYLSPRPRPGDWADLSFVLEGISVQAFGDVFRSDWEVASGERLNPAKPRAPSTGGTATVQIVPSGPDIEEDPLHDGLVRALHMARSRICIVTPYFVPTDGLLAALTIAARRGVDVRLLVPARSNQRLADLARGGYLRDLARAGAKVLAYQPGMIHAKAGVIDDIAYVGSANFDVRSMLLNFEVTMFLYDGGSVAELAHWFETLAEDCTEELPPRGALRRIGEGLFRLGAPVL
jgi:cardiolipin synthase A/B